MTEEEVYQAIRERRCPMALVPLDVEEAIGRRYRLIRRGERMGKWGIVIAVAAAIVAFAMIGPYNRGEVSQAITIIGVGLLFIAVTAMAVAVIGGLHYCDQRDNDEKTLGRLGYSPEEFAQKFAVIIAVLGERSQRMGRWTIMTVAEDVKTILRDQAKLAKCLQDIFPNDPFAGLDERQKFRDLHKIFTEWDLNPGPYGQYFV